MDQNQIRNSPYFANKTKQVVEQFDEYFVDCVDHPNYMVSQYGRIYSKKTSKFSNLFPDKDGYLRTQMDNKTIKVHRAVALAFIPNDTEHYGDVVNHKNGRKTDNYIDNLEFTTTLENTRHALTMGLHKIYCEDNPHAKYNNAHVEKECELLSKGYGTFEIAEIMNVPYTQSYATHLSSLRHKKLYKKISTKYDFSNCKLNSRRDCIK
jgi:hypothetical protein